MSLSVSSELSVSSSTASASASEKNRAREIWSRCLPILKEMLSSVEYETWILPLKPLSFDGKRFLLWVPSDYFMEWIDTHYVGQILKVLRTVCGHTVQLEYAVAVLHMQGEFSDNEDGLASDSMYLPSGLHHRTPERESSWTPWVELNPAYTFETFVEGTCNRMARTAALTVSQAPGRNPYNPLVLFGKTGTGKTHLLHATGNAIRQRFPDARVLLVPAELFVNQFVRMARKNALEEFKQMFYTVDVLLVDDVQFLAGKPRTQDVFFHLFEYLHERRRQIVLSMDVPPSRLSGFPERLLSRFRSALVAELQYPDYEMRVEILRRRAHREGIHLPEEVYTFLAREVQGSIRDLEGALIGIMAELALRDQHASSTLSIPEIQGLLRRYIQRAEEQPTLDQIVEEVARLTGMDSEMLRSSASRQQAVVDARDLVIYLARRVLHLSQTDLARYFGWESSRIAHALRRIPEKFRRRPILQKYAEEILRRKFRRSSGNFSGKSGV